MEVVNIVHFVISTETLFILPTLHRNRYYGSKFSHYNMQVNNFTNALWVRIMVDAITSCGPQTPGGTSVNRFETLLPSNNWGTHPRTPRKGVGWVTLREVFNQL